jgi:glycosyltransferase involved in cell wall biosynthesis
MAILLSILIPTFNRPQSVKSTLNVIQTQINKAGVQNLVEVVIGDNSDKRNYELELFSAKNSIRYFSHSKNLGQAQNINFLIREANGRYIWLMSDDDFIESFAIQAVIDEIASIELDSSAVNFLTFLAGGHNSKNLWIKNTEKGFWRRGEEFLNDSWEHAVFISDNILKRETLIRIMDELNLWNRLNDTYQNSAISFSVIFLEGGVKVIPKTLVYDTFTPKLYRLDQGIRVRVTDLMKLSKLYKELGMKSATLKPLRKQILRNFLSWLVISQLCLQVKMFTENKPLIVKDDKVSRLSALFLRLFRMELSASFLRWIICKTIKVVKPGVYANGVVEFNHINNNLKNEELFQTYDS